jgi:hypothetical protein
MDKLKIIKGEELLENLYAINHGNFLLWTVVGAILYLYLTHDTRIRHRNN